MVPKSHHLDLAALIDHTLLRADARPSEIEVLCEEARRYGFHSVCVNPAWVSLCTEELKALKVKVCTVVGFPLGASTTEIKRFEAEHVIRQGAEEIDMVINIGALKAGESGKVQREISEIASLCRSQGVLLKVIIETALLDDREKELACRLAVEGGADFVKTSTGFSRGGATTEDVALMRRVVGADFGVKASGGIRDTATALAMLAAGANRLGTSASVAIVKGI